MRYEPKFGRVLIERQKIKASGIIIPEDVSKRTAPCTGKIIALGETAGWTEAFNSGESKPLQTLSVGDTVLFGRHSGAYVDGEETLFICQDQDILAVIKE